VGGPTDPDKIPSTIYRGDSFICGASIHAGIIDDQRGGCGVISLLGERSNFPSVEGNGIRSVAFDSSFPLAFTFDREDSPVPRALSQCSDPRWRLLAVSVIFTSVLSLFTRSSALFFGSIFTGIFFHVALASDPPDFPDFNSVVSAAVGRFLPAAFVGLGIYLYCVQRTLRNLNALVEKTILWLGGCWLGALSNTTFDLIPIQRLTPHDLKQQPGAISALVFIILLILAIALVQAWAFRIEGRLTRYLGLYAGIGATILLLLAIPGLKLRIHHYILALLLLPGTSLQTRPSLLFQGLLIGLFINGIARWDFASVLQTPASLLEDGQLGSLLPAAIAPVISASNITFGWDTIAADYDGISVLVNDVERYRGFQDRGDLEFSWQRRYDGKPEYFRFAYVKYAHMGGPWVADYTKTSIWKEDGDWVQMPSG
jgi:LCCL domain